MTLNRDLSRYISTIRPAKTRQARVRQYASGSAFIDQNYTTPKENEQARIRLARKLRL